MAQLHRKWCVHSILPVATRVKQRIHVNTQNIKTLQKALFVPSQEHKHIHTQYTGLWNSLGFNWQAEWTEHVAVAFVIVHVKWLGGTLHRVNESETARMLQTTT